MDNDLISRQAAIDALDEIEAEVADGYGYQYAKWREYFAEMPPAQPEIIRCRNCKYNDMPPTAGNAGCTLLYGMTNQNGFCSLAERREVSE